MHVSQQDPIFAYLIIQYASLLVVRSSTNREHSRPLRECVRSKVYCRKSSQHEDLENTASQAGGLVLRTSRVTAHDDCAVVDASRMSKPSGSTVGNSKLLTCTANEGVSNGEDGESVEGVRHSEQGEHSPEHGDGGGLRESERERL